MKKPIKGLLVMLTALSLAACQSGRPKPEDKESTDQDKEKNVLVAVFSATGNTKDLADIVAEELDADVFVIEPEQPYTKEDMDYNTDGRCDREQADESARPAIANKVDNMDAYDTVIVAYPIWHGQAPRIISTFLESYDFSGKTMAAFCTSASSPLGESAEKLHPLVDESVTWLESRRFEAGEQPEVLKEWLEQIGLLNADTAALFDMEQKTVALNNGKTMPIVGLGTYSLDHDTCVQSVKTHLKNGGRLIDTAFMYGNEEAVGQGVKEAMAEYGIAREEIFVITKIYPSQYEDPDTAIRQALDKLDLGTIDMMLLHHPGDHDVQAYLAMEEYVRQGLIGSIGLSNYYIEELEAFLPQVNIPPALVQNEIHPYYQEQDVVPFIQEKGIVMQGWYPLGGRGYTKELLNNETIAAIAEKHHVSAAQVILRWNLQRNIVVIPGSSDPEHIKENLDLFSFSLSEEEMKQIRALDRNEKHDWY
ncbi:MAG: aldo/keto reductase [Erysipelotrichaceae bacterium]|nr:aldo/keto reductase [Erysipelotrichaceae bacterium]